MTVTFDNFAARPAQGKLTWYQDREAYDTSVENEVKRRFANSRGSLPEGSNLNDFYTATYGGAWLITSTIWPTLTNAPTLETTTTEPLILMVFQGGSPAGTIQILSHRYETWIRTRPNITWREWRKILTLDDLAKVKPKNVTAAMKIEDLEPGDYYFDFLSAVTANNLPGNKFGTLSIEKITGSFKRMIFMTGLGKANAVGSAVQEFEVWVRGMDRDSNGVGVWKSGWEKVFPSAPAPEVKVPLPITDMLTAQRAVVMMSPTEMVYNKGGDVADRPASMTKLLMAYTAYSVLGSAGMSEDVTVLDTDPSSQPNWSGNAIPLLPGDVLSFKELFYLAAVPSHNQACEIIARAVGDRMEGSGTSREKFLAQMNAFCTQFGYTGANFVDPHGLSSSNKIRPRDMADVMFKDLEIPAIKDAFAQTKIKVTVRGAQPRTLEATNGMYDYGLESFPDRVASKAGSLTGWYNLAIAFSTSGAQPGVAVLMGSTSAGRYPDTRALINLAKDRYNRQYLL